MRILTLCVLVVTAGWGVVTKPASAQLMLEHAWLPVQVSPLNAPTFKCRLLSSPGTMSPAKDKAFAVELLSATKACKVVRPQEAEDRLLQVEVQLNERGDYGERDWASKSIIAYIHDTDAKQPTAIPVVQRDELGNGLFDTLQKAPVGEKSYGLDQLVVVSVRMRDALESKYKSLQKGQAKVELSELVYEPYVSVAVRQLQVVKRLAEEFGIGTARRDYDFAYKLVRESTQGDKNKQLVRSFRVGTLKELETLIADVEDLVRHRVLTYLTKAYDPPDCRFLKAVVAYHDEMPAAAKAPFEATVLDRAKVRWQDVMAKAKICDKSA